MKFLRIAAWFYSGRGRGKKKSTPGGTLTSNIAFMNDAFNALRW